MKKIKLEVFDPPMCCLSGICGPNVNPALVKFASDLEWLKTQNIDVVRYNLSSNPDAFAHNESIKKAITDESNKCLPIIMVDEIIMSKGVYPSRDELMNFLGIKSEALPLKENDMKNSDNDGCCGPGCDCNKPSGSKRLKTAICLIILAAVAGILFYKAKTGKQAVYENTATAFALPAVNDVNDQKAEVKEVDNKKVGEFLDSLASLNKVAINQDAVFVFIPATSSDIVSKETIDAIASARQKIESNGVKLGLYTLQSGSPEYSNIVAQLPLPGMLVMSKGRGMGIVSGEITETKILQAYVASSRAGGCCPSGGSSSCGPSSSPVGPRVR